MFSLTVSLAVVIASLVGSVITGAVSTVDNSNLIAVREVFRHGDRTPTAFYANDPYQDESFWPVGPGQLTNEGKQRHYRLGEFTRERYAGFFPESYNNNDFQIQTTDVDRTHMSAQADLAALFPPKGDEIWNNRLKWQPIPVHPSVETVISSSPSCTSYYLEWATVMAEGSFLPTDVNYTELYAYLTENSGTAVTSISSLYTINDALYIEERNGFELPEWTKKVYPQPLRRVGNYFFLSFAYTDNQKRLTSGGWLNDIITDFEEIWEDSTSNPKYKIYSAHDSNIASILNTIGAFHIHSPFFAATIFVELRNVSGVPTVNIFYKNDEDFNQITSLNCGLDCPLADFKSNLSPWIVNADEWNEICSKTSTDYTVTSTALSEEVEQAQAEIVEHANNKWGNKVNPGRGNKPR